MEWVKASHATNDQCKVTGAWENVQIKKSAHFVSTVQLSQKVDPRGRQEIRAARIHFTPNEAVDERFEQFFRLLADEAYYSAVWDKVATQLQNIEAETTHEQLLKRCIKS